MKIRLLIPRKKQRRAIRFAFALLLFIGNVAPSRSAPLSLDSAVSVQPLKGIAQYHRASETATLDEVQALKNWRPVRESVMALEEGSALWLKMEFQQNGSESARYFLSTPAPWPESVTFFCRIGVQETLQRSGTGAFVSHSHSKPTLQIELKPGHRATVYIRLKSYRRVPTEFILYSESAHLEKQTLRYTLLGLFGGTVLMLILLHTLMYGGLRDPLLSRYLLWMISVAIYFVFRTRFSLILLAPGLAGYSQWMHTVSVCLVAISAIRFGRYYLSLARTSASADMAARIIQYSSALPILLLPFAERFAHELAGLAGLFVGPPMLIIALIGLKRGARDSYLFLFAWSLPIFAAMFENLSYATERMENRTLLPLAFLAEFLLFSLVIRRKIRESESNRIANRLTLHRVSQELGFARKIQKDLMPSAQHNLENARIEVYYEPRQEVGGDYCDVVHPGPDHVGLFVADVTGHGMTAALDAALVRLALRSVYQGNYSAASTLEAINGFLYEHLQYRFVSAIYCVLNVRTGKGCVCAAGHPPGLLLKPGQPPSILESTGPLLGVVAKWEGMDTAISMEQGDRLFLFTDGLFQREDRFGLETSMDEAFSRERELFSGSAGRLSEIMERSHRLRGGPATDDIAIIQIEYSVSGSVSG